MCDLNNFKHKAYSKTRTFYHNHYYVKYFNHEIHNSKK